MQQRTGFPKNPTSQALPLRTVSRNLEKLAKENFQQLETQLLRERKYQSLSGAGDPPLPPAAGPGNRMPESAARPGGRDSRRPRSPRGRREGGPGAHFVLGLRTSRPVLHPPSRPSNLREAGATLLPRARVPGTL